MQCIHVCVCVWGEGGGGNANVELFYVKAGGKCCSHYALNGQTLCCVNVMAKIRAENRQL